MVFNLVNSGGRRAESVFVIAARRPVHRPPASGGATGPRLGVLDGGHLVLIVIVRVFVFPGWAVLGLTRGAVQLVHCRNSLLEETVIRGLAR
jgi:hypothetical protein